MRDKDKMKGRNWLLTLNNPDIIPAEYIENVYTKLKATYACG